MNRLLAIGALTFMLIAHDSGRVDGPRLVTAQNLPPDVRQLTDDTWVSFLGVFTGKRGCIGTVELELVDHVAGGAAQYRAVERLIRIEIPSSPIRFPESLAHELGHHLEEVCGVEPEIGAAFRVANGLEARADWARADRWQDRPSEHFAEVVVAVVLGERHTHADVIMLRPSAVELVEAWGHSLPE